MKTPRAPSPPDPQETAAAQTGSSIGTAIANQYLQPNQATPWGRMTNTQTGTASWTDPSSGRTYEIPQFTQTTTLPRNQQRLLDTQTANNQRIANIGGRQATQLGSILGRRASAPNLGEMSGTGPNMGEVGRGPQLRTDYGPTDFSSDRAKVERALLSRMNPALQQARDRMTAQLSNQGIKVGSEAYDREMANLGQNENDARMQAILAGGGEQSRLAGLARDQATFGNDAMQQMFQNRMAGTGFNNAARQGEFDNRMSALGFNNDARAREFGMGQQLRSGAVNEANALRAGGQVQMPVMPGVQSPQMPNVDMGGLINNQYQGQMANWQQQMQGRNQMMGGLFGLGASLASVLPFGAMLSDERTKENVEPLGVEVEGNPVYAYEYKHDPGTRHVGVMAQDVARTRPDAVVPMGGLLGVNYRKLVA